MKTITWQVMRRHFMLLAILHHHHLIITADVWKPARAALMHKLAVEGGRWLTGGNFWLKTNLEGGGRSRFLGETFPWFRAHFASQRRRPISRMNPTLSTTAEAPCGPANAGITTLLENLPPGNERSQNELSLSDYSLHEAYKNFGIHIRAIGTWICRTKSDNDGDYPMHRHTKCHSFCSDSVGEYFREQKTRNWTGSNSKH